MRKGAGGRSISILIMLAFLAFEPCEKQEKQTTKKILLAAVWRVDLEGPRGDLKRPERLHLARE